MAGLDPSGEGGKSFWRSGGRIGEEIAGGQIQPRGTLSRLLVRCERGAGGARMCSVRALHAACRCSRVLARRRVKPRCTFVWCLVFWACCAGPVYGTAARLGRRAQSIGSLHEFEWEVQCVQDCVGERQRWSLWGTLEIHEHAHACIWESLVSETL